MNTQRCNTGKKAFLGLVIVGILTMAGGCGPKLKHMALTENMTSLDLSKESVAVFVVRVSNQVNVDCQARYGLSGTLKDANGKQQEFSGTVVVKTIEKQYGEFLVSLALTPGHYELRGLSTSLTNRAGFILSHCAIPIYLSFDIDAQQVVYLGRIEATMRKKEGEEVVAGFFLPLFDQAASGVTSGTFDVKIVDDYENDMLEFKQRYLVLDNQKIQKTILPQWRRLTSEEIDGLN
jgi:hypothetical protein